MINDVRSEIQPIKDDLNQFKENSNERFSKSQDELNQFKVNSNENLSNLIEIKIPSSVPEIQ